MENIYDYTVEDIYGRKIKLDHYRGKVVIIVNTAYHCGLNSQLNQLESLYHMYHLKGVEILAFPSYSFWGESKRKEAETVRCNYGVSFPVMQKVSVRGTKAHPLFKYLSDKRLNGVIDRTPTWNFQKYLIDKEGRLVRVFSPFLSPLNAKVRKSVEALL